MADEKEKTEAPSPGRNKEEIALEMMKFIAVTTGYGKGTGPSTGFNKSTVRTAEDHAEALIELYQRCRKVVD